MNNILPISLPDIDKNISTPERVVSVLGGCYLMYDALKYKRNIAEIAAAGFMLFRGVSGYCPATHLALTMLDRHNQPHRNSGPSNVNIHARMLVNRPVAEVFAFWRNLGNLPLFMEHLKDVDVLSETESEWKAGLPGGIGSISWKAAIVKEEHNKFIGWSSLPGSTVRNAGKVQFKDAGELGTLVHVVFSYHAPLGSAGEEIAKLLNPVFENMVRKDIMGFKRFMETGTPERISQETVTIFT